MNLKRVAALTVALLGATTAVVSPVGAGEGPGGNPTDPQTVEAGDGIPGTKAGPKDYSAQVGAAIDTGPPMCRQRNTGVMVPIQRKDIGTGPDFPVQDWDPGPPPEPGLHYIVFYCPALNQWSDPANWLPGSDWDADDPEPPPPTPEQVRDGLWAIARGFLYAPDVDLSAEGTANILNTPTFFEITNPQVSTLYTATVQGVYVWIAVVPSHALHPGEDGALPVACDEDGTAFDPDGDEPDEQAEAANGCVYTYSQPSAGWNGDVTITWDVTWGSNQAGGGGTIAAAPSVGGFTRIVDEMETMVTPTEDEA